MASQSESAFAGTLASAAREAQEDVRRHKKAARDHRKAARQAAAKLARIEQECARRGIALIVEPNT